MALMAMTGGGCLIAGLATPTQLRVISALVARLLESGNYLIKGTIMGALAGLLVNAVVLGAGRIGNLAAIPGAALGLTLGVALDAIAHRRKHSRPFQSRADGDALRNAEPPMRESKIAPIIGSQSWGLSPDLPQPSRSRPEEASPVVKE